MAHHFRDRVVGSNEEPFIVLLTKNGKPFGLTGSTSTFRMVAKNNPTTVPINNQPCESPDVKGHVRFEPTIGQIVAGKFWVRTTTTFPSGRVFTTPRIGVEIVADI